jgi:Uma2 family endonuclease
VALPKPKTHWTDEEYLRFERDSSVRHELIDGQMYAKDEVENAYAMAGAKREHSLIVANLVASLVNQTGDRPREVYPTEMRVRVKANDYFYPDVVVVCGEPKFADEEFDVLLNPTVVFEVLSPSTALYDKELKTRAYIQRESLQDIVLIDQAAPVVLHRVRQSPNSWILKEVVGQGVVDLPSIGCTLPLNEIYRKITFPGGNE